jgi:hypothetical protein
MTMTAPLPILAVSLAAVVLSACTETRYVAYDDSEKEGGAFNRTVEFEVKKTFYDDPPECAVVLPFQVEGKAHPHSGIIENAMARQLSGRMTRVVGPMERNHLTRNLAVDLSHTGDRKTFARSTKCGFVLEAKPWNTESTYLVFWSQARIGLEMSLIRVRDDKVVWQARHVAARSDGGIPLSPVSAIYNIFQAASFQGDGDVNFSLADDAVRRIVKTLPDVRFYASTTSPRRPSGKQGSWRDQLPKK